MIASRARRVLVMAQEAKSVAETHLATMSIYTHNPQIKEVCERKQGHIEILDAVIDALENGDFTLLGIYNHTS